VRNFDRGFDHFTNVRIERRGDRFTAGESSEAQGAGKKTAIKELLGRLNALSAKPSRLGYTAFRANQLYWGEWPTVDGQDVISELIDSIDPSATDPQFHWTHLNDLHSPLHPDRVLGDELAGMGRLRQLYADSARLLHYPAPVYEQMYDGVLRYLDREIGRVIQYLKETDMIDDTIVVVTADHGDAFRERGIYGHAAGHERRYHYDDRDYLHRELLHVPLLVRTPDTNSRRLSAPTSLMWLHELIAEAAELSTGDFPQRSGRRHFSPERGGGEYCPVISDTIPKDGHTVAVRDERGMIYTDAAMPADGTPTPSDDWWFFRPGDRMERDRLSVDRAPPALIDTCQQVLKHPERMSTLGDEVDDETMGMLADLGYR
jgi:hypothetical protein